MATGGLSIPKMGATGFGYDLARQFGLAIRETRPGLVPLLFGADEPRRYADLAGVSAEVIAACDGQRFREKMLVTHRGLSGPAILQISSYWKKPESILIDLAPEPGGHGGASRGNRAAKYHLTAGGVAQILPNRLADRWLEIHATQELDQRLSQGTGAQDTRVGCGSGGYGGLRKGRSDRGRRGYRRIVGENDGKPESAGLFFIGEVVDVTGHLGGFNFQWAWASGASAGRAL